MSAETLDRDDRVNAAIALVEAAGYRVVLQEPWTTSEALRHDYGLSSVQMCVLLKHPLCPSYEAERSATGRLLRLRPNPALRDFLASKASAARRRGPHPASRL